MGEVEESNVPIVSLPVVDTSELDSTSIMNGTEEVHISAVVQAVDHTTNGTNTSSESVQVTAAITEVTSIPIGTDISAVQEEVVAIQAEADTQPTPSPDLIDPAHGPDGGPKTSADEELLLGVSRPISC